MFCSSRRTRLSASLSRLRRVGGSITAFYQPQSTLGPFFDSYSGFGLWLDSGDSPARQNAPASQILNLAGMLGGECHIGPARLGLHPIPNAEEPREGRGHR